MGLLFVISLFPSSFEPICFLKTHLLISWTCDPLFLPLGLNGFCSLSFANFSVLLGWASFLTFGFHKKRPSTGLSQTWYIDKFLERFSMQNSKKGLLPFKHGVPLSNDQRSKTFEEENIIRQVPYASAVGILMYAMLCTRPNICYSVGMVSRYQSNPGLKHWHVVKYILKYLQRTRDYILVYHSEDLIPIGYTDSDL